MWTKINKRLCILGFCFLFLVACNVSDKNDSTSGNDGSTNKDETEQTGGTFTIATMVEPETLDMHKTSGEGDTNVVGSHLGDALLVFNPDTNKLEPHLAEEYDVSDDGKTLTFKLRENIVFHDGTPFTATVFKESLDRVLDPDTGAGIAGALFTSIDSVSAPDEYTLVLELSEPSASLLTNLSFAGFSQPLSVKAIEQHGDDYGRNPVGLGPWVFNEWVTGQSVSFIRNKDYQWGPSFYENKGSPHLDELIFKFIPDYQTRITALDSNSIDMALYVDAKDIQKYLDDDGFEVIELDIPALGLLIEMNLESEKLQDVNVRKALNLAIDKNVFIQAVLHGHGEVAHGPLPPSLFGYDEEIENYGYKYDKEQAIALLEKSGWNKNNNGMMEKNGEELSLELSIYEPHQQSAQIFQQMLKEIGVDITIQMMERSTLDEMAGEGDYELKTMDYGHVDPEILFMLFHSSQIGGMNLTQANNPELDKLLEQGNTEMDLQKRKEIYADAQKVISDGAYIIPVYSQKIFHVVNTNFENVRVSPQGTVLLNDSRRK